MPTDVTIRSCREDELAAVLGLWQTAGSTPSPLDTVPALQQLYRKDRDAILVAEAAGRIVGTVVGGWDGWRGNIYRLAVLPDNRRRGIGRALVEEIERRIDKKGARKISICVVHEQDSAVLFWNAMGAAGYNRDYRIIRYAKSLDNL